MVREVKGIEKMVSQLADDSCVFTPTDADLRLSFFRNRVEWSDKLANLKVLTRRFEFIMALLEFCMLKWFSRRSGVLVQHPKGSFVV